MPKKKSSFQSYSELSYKAKTRALNKLDDHLVEWTDIYKKRLSQQSYIEYVATVKNYEKRSFTDNEVNIMLTKIKIDTINNMRKLIKKYNDEFYSYFLAGETKRKNKEQKEDSEDKPKTYKSNKRYYYYKYKKRTYKKK